MQPPPPTPRVNVPTPGKSWIRHWNPLVLLFRKSVFAFCVNIYAAVDPETQNIGGVCVWGGHNPLRRNKTEKWACRKFSIWIHHWHAGVQTNRQTDRQIHTHTHTHTHTLADRQTHTHTHANTYLSVGPDDFSGCTCCLSPVTTRCTGCCCGFACCLDGRIFSYSLFVARRRFTSFQAQ